MIIKDKDKRIWQDYKKSCKILNDWELGESYTLPVKLVNPKTGLAKTYRLRVKPCNGSSNGGPVGLEEGWVHFEYIDHTVNKRAWGLCDINYFFIRAKR